LVVAAIELMAEGGESAVTLVAVAQRAGVARGTVYHHFESRDALISQMHESLENHLLRLSDGTRPFASPFGLIPKLAAEDESYVRSRMYRILEQGPLSDPRTASLITWYKSKEARKILRVEADPELLAFMTSAMDLAGLMAISRGQTPGARRELAGKLGRLIYQVFCFGILDPDKDPNFPKPPPVKPSRAPERVETKRGGRGS
jgi:AcrR family transcriptional regulator